MANADPRQLVKVLSEHYSTSELKSMCFDIGIDYEDLGGQGKAGKARELVQFAERRGRLGEIMTYVRKTRPHVNLAGGDPMPPINPRAAEPQAHEQSPVVQEVHNYYGTVNQQGEGGTIAHEIDNSKTTNINQQGQTVNAPQINTAGDANIGQVGDNTNIDGNQIQGDNVQGDKMSEGKSSIVVGDLTGVSGVAIGDNAQATGGNIHMSVMPSVDDSKKKEIEKLIAELNKALENVPTNKTEEAEAVTMTAKALIETASAEKPNKTMLQISGAGLKQAAENIADVMPTVLGIATKLVAMFV